MAELMLLSDEGGAWRDGGVGVGGGVQRQPRLVQGGAQDGQAAGRAKTKLLEAELILDHFCSKRV